MFTAWIESFHSEVNLSAPKAKCFEVTMLARVAAAVLAWNKDKISSVFCQGGTAGTVDAEKWEKEKQKRIGYDDRIFSALISAGKLFEKGDRKPDAIPIPSFDTEEMVDSEDDSTGKGASPALSGSKRRRR